MTAQAQDRKGADPHLRDGLVLFDALARQVIAQGRRAGKIGGGHWPVLLRRFRLCGVGEGAPAGPRERGQALGRVLAGTDEGWRGGAAQNAVRCVFGRQAQPEPGLLEILAGAVETPGSGGLALRALMTSGSLGMACIRESLPPEAAAWLVAGLRLHMDERSRQVADAFFPGMGWGSSDPLIEAMATVAGGWNGDERKRFAVAQLQAEVAVDEANARAPGGGWGAMLYGARRADKARQALAMRLAMADDAQRLAGRAQGGRRRVRA